jgi:enoyl-[acyl-carrier-protein] reductase (NADH)
LRLEAASGIEHFDESQGTLRRRVEACEVGCAVVMLVSDYASAVIVDVGFHIAGIIFH